MPCFLRILDDEQKESTLLAVASAFRAGTADSRIFHTDADAFRHLPNSSFAYWADPAIKSAFVELPAFESQDSTLVAKRGVNSNDDFRFIRAWWEPQVGCSRWVAHPKGGPFSPFYADLHLVIDWHPDGRHLSAQRQTDRVYASAIIPSRELYFRPGLTWSLRTKSKISLRVMPSGCVFGSKGPAVIESADDYKVLLSMLALTNSESFYSLVKIQLAAADAKAGGAAHSFEVGVIQKTPIPYLDPEKIERLSSLARRAWSCKRKLDIVNEISHAFHLPMSLISRIPEYDFEALRRDFSEAESQINSIAADIYGITITPSTAAIRQTLIDDGVAASVTANTDDSDDDDSASSISQKESLLSWSVGVVFGRFDWRLATGERDAPTEPDPFDPLPAKSPGMSPEGAVLFHAHSGILVDDQGHSHDLPRRIEEVLTRVQLDVPGDVRRWLQRDFFTMHLSQYSKSRRRAPIYWSLSTNSGSYALWLYYPSLTSETLYSAVNEFVEPKLKQVNRGTAALRDKGAARSREDERAFEALQILELELIELRDTLLQIAPTYRPNHDDGVQITAAPLWQLFRHKPWQKILKDTWVKLEKGDYDWAHLAMAYWPDRVREKCKADKSLAIAHGLEHLYIEPTAEPKNAFGRRKAGAR